MCLGQDSASATEIALRSPRAKRFGQDKTGGLCSNSGDFNRCAVLTALAVAIRQILPTLTSTYLHPLP